MGIDEVIGSKREEILRIAAKHGVTSIRVFGSTEHLPALKPQVARMLAELS